MKKATRILIACVVSLLFAGPALASFPVNSKTKSPLPAGIIKKTGVDQTITSKAEAKLSELKKDYSGNSAKAADHDDEFWITLALWFFLGGLAAHRWYKKKPVGWNILFILTGGGCGVWWIIDLIHILQGKF